MADRIEVPEELFRNFTQLGTLRDYVSKGREKWNNIESSLESAAGNDEEMSESIKKQAKELHPNISSLLSTVGEVFSTASEHGQKVSNLFQETDEQSRQEVDKIKDE